MTIDQDNKKGRSIWYNQDDKNVRYDDWNAKTTQTATTKKRWIIIFEWPRVSTDAMMS